VTPRSRELFGGRAAAVRHPREGEAFEEARRRDATPPLALAPPPARTRAGLNGKGIYGYETKAGTGYRFRGRERQPDPLRDGPRTRRTRKLQPPE